MLENKQKATFWRRVCEILRDEHNIVAHPRSAEVVHERLFADGLRFLSDGSDTKTETPEAKTELAQDEKTNLTKVESVVAAD